MESLPNYMENIIIAVILNDRFRWYVSSKELWYLDMEKRMDAFEKAGYPIDKEHIEEIRRNNLILTKSNANNFLKFIEYDQATTSELREFLELSIYEGNKNKDDSWFFDYRPSLYVNFDTEEFYSNYSEPIAYEMYAPSDWISEYRDFNDKIPQKERYWIDDLGNNLLIEPEYIPKIKLMEK